MKCAGERSSAVIEVIPGDAAPAVPVSGSLRTISSTERSNSCAKATIPPGVLRLLSLFRCVGIAALKCLTTAAGVFQSVTPGVTREKELMAAAQHVRDVCCVVGGRMRHCAPIAVVLSSRRTPLLNQPSRENARGLRRESEAQA